MIRFEYEHEEDEAFPYVFAPRLSGSLSRRERLHVTRETFHWCKDQFDTPGVTNYDWYSSNGVFWFQNETQACAFRLRWC